MEATMRSSSSLVVIVTSTLLVAACAPEPPRDRAPGPLTVAPRAEVIAPTIEAPVPEPAPKLTSVPDEDIVENRDSRDPFRSFDAMKPVTPPDERPRKSKRYAVGELKLVGLVTSTATPRAMLLDPAGKGWVVTQGELVGRPEEVHAGSGVVTASWRVDRIRVGDVVLVQEDSAHREGALATRVLSLPREAPPQSIDD
jgi:type IV pilus assembly protein PilP